MGMKDFFHSVLVLSAVIILLGPWHNVAFAKDGFFMPQNVIGEETDEYKPLTYENISKMYWAIGKFEFSDQLAIQQYLMINECDIYRKYSNNEFEFQEIVEATQEYIKKNIYSFPAKAEILVPLKLDSYDIEEEVFWSDNNSAPTNVTRVDLTSPYPNLKCLTGTYELDLYPLGMIITFDKAFTVSKIPVDPEVAKLYLEEVARKFADAPTRYERIVYLRVKLRFLQFQTEWYKGGVRRVELLARLEGYEIYADVEKQKLMYREDFKDRRIRKAKYRKSDGSEDSSEKEGVEEIIEQE